MFKIWVICMVLVDIVVIFLINKIVNLCLWKILLFIGNVLDMRIRYFEVF